MPFQPVNFANIDPIGDTSARNLVASLLAGYKAEQAPAQMSREAQEADLMNKQRLYNLQAQPEKDRLATAFKQMQLKYMPQEYEQNQQLKSAEIGQENIKTQLAQRELDAMRYLQNLTSNTPGAPQMPGDFAAPPPETVSPSGEHSIPGAKDPNQLASLNQPDALAPIRNASITTVTPGNPDMYKFDDAYANNPGIRKTMNSMGLQIKKDMTTNPATGQVIIRTQYPSGKVEMQAVDVGRTPEDIERAKGFAKGDVDIYNQGNKDISALQSQKVDLNRLYQLTQQAGFSDAIGPVNQQLAKYFGTKEAKALLGDVMTTSGNIALDAAKSLKGAFTGRDLGLINSIKPNASDQAPMFIAKVKAMNDLNNAISNMVMIRNQYIHQGYSAPDALSMAKKQVDIMPIINSVNPEKIEANKNAQMAKQREQQYTPSDNVKNIVLPMSLEQKKALYKEWSGQQ